MNLLDYAQKTLILLRHVPGAGASTYADLIKRLNPDAVVAYAADDFVLNPETGEYEWTKERVKTAHELCQYSTEQAMIGETPVVIVHNTFTKRWEMDTYYEMAERHGYRIISNIVENRHGGVNIHDVPADKLAQMQNRFEIQLGERMLSPWLSKSLAEILEVQKSVPQRPDWHPEGNNYRHISIVMSRIAKDEDTLPAIDFLILLATALFHDLGKVDVSRYDPLRAVVTAYGHAEASVDYWDKFAHRFVLDREQDIKDSVRWMIAQHMNAKFVDTMKPEKAALLKTHPLWSLMTQFSHYDSMIDLTEEEIEEHAYIGDEMIQLMLEFFEQKEEEPA